MVHVEHVYRDIMLIVPSGSYRTVNPYETNIVAKEFYDRGFNVFVLTYTTNYYFEKPVKDQSLADISRAIKLLRTNYIQSSEQKIVLYGFSAGAHLSLRVANLQEELVDFKHPDVSSRPDALIVGYPLVSFTQLVHRTSARALLGDNPTPKELHQMSIENILTPNGPPIFIWHYRSDEAVYVQRSYLLAQACNKQWGQLYTFGQFIQRTTERLALGKEVDEEKSYTLYKYVKAGILPDKK